MELSDDFAPLFTLVNKGRSFLPPFDIFSYSSPTIQPCETPEKHNRSRALTVSSRQVTAPAFPRSTEILLKVCGCWSLLTTREVLFITCHHQEQEWRKQKSQWIAFKGEKNRFSIRAVTPARAPLGAKFQKKWDSWSISGTEVVVAKKSSFWLDIIHTAAKVASTPLLGFFILILYMFLLLFVYIFVLYILLCGTHTPAPTLFSLCVCVCA